MLGEVIVEWSAPMEVEPARAYDPGWRGRAHCRGVVDVSTLFVRDKERVETAAKRLRPFARMYCRPCPARLDCQAQSEPYGLWGGELRNGDTVRDLLAPPVPKQRKERE